MERTLHHEKSLHEPRSCGAGAVVMGAASMKLSREKNMGVDAFVLEDEEKKTSFS